MSVPAVSYGAGMQTSAFGSMYRPALAVMVIATGLSGPATASSYELPRLTERTASEPAGRIERRSRESTGQAMLEIRRRSGLTWEDLADLFDVSRRSVHHWANGKRPSAKHERAIHKMLSAMRQLDRGSQSETRALLHATEDSESILDLLKRGSINEALRLVEMPADHTTRKTPLSAAAARSRRPVSPSALLEAEQEHPRFPSNARTVPARRISKKSG